MYGCRVFCGKAKQVRSPILVEIHRKKWPEKSTKVNFFRIHKRREVASWCTYVLEYPRTVPASSLGSKDYKIFNPMRICNAEIFPGYRMEGNELAERVSKQIKIYARVVPYQDM